MIIYKNYDKAALDSQYNNRARVPNFEQIVQRWETESEQLRQRVKSYRGVSYGSRAREYLDIFPAAHPGAPLQVFFHGGYWQALQSGVFHFITNGFLRHGITTVFVNYPLAPEASMDEIVEACRQAIIWLYRHAAEYGGNPNQIYISGHSAGGHLAAMLMATYWKTLAEELPHNLIKGGCAISGLFNLIPIQLSYVNDKIGLDKAAAQRNSPAFLTPASSSPLIVSVGGAESEEYHAQSQELTAAWSQHGLSITELILEGRHHFSILDSLVDPEGALNRAILGQMGV